MKKILSVILSAAVIAASAAVPVFADYAEHEYDVVEYTETFDSGEATNAIDNTPALKVADTDDKGDFKTIEVFRTTEVAKDFNSNNGFFLSFDFCFEDEATSEINLRHLTDKSPVGPILTYGPKNTKPADADNKQLRTQTGGTAWQLLGDITFGDWYTAEMEGRTGIADSYTTFRLYDSAHNLVQETKNFNFRNLSSGDRSFQVMNAKNVSLDNIKLISENPDSMSILSSEDTLKSGQSMTMSHKTFRDDTEFAPHSDKITWSVNGSGVSINEKTGLLAADTDAASQTVTVTASIPFGSKTLTQTKDIEIVAVDTSLEPFDTAVISGEEEVKAGTETTFDVTLTKDGSPVVPKDGDVVWSVYNYNNTVQYYGNSYTGQKPIDITGGKLIIAPNVLPQTITLRASTPSGDIFGKKTVDIKWADSQVETVLKNYSYDDTASAPASSENQAASVDGSTAFKVTADVTEKFGNQAITLTEFDVKFAAAGAGLQLKRNDTNVTNSSIVYSNGSISSLGLSVDQDSWYHCELMYSNVIASCIIYKYNADGTLGAPQVYKDIDKGGKGGDGNYTQNGAFTIKAGTVIDNLKVSIPLAKEIAVKAPVSTVFAGETAQFTATASRNGLPFPSADGLTWSVVDAEGLPILDDTITVNSQGLLTVSAMASPGTVTVRASASQGSSGAATVAISVSEMFTVEKLAKNKDGNKIVRIYATKNFYYDDDVMFMVTVKDKDGILKALKITKTFGDRLRIGENEITTDLDLPADFDPATDKIEAMVWTTF